MKNSPTQSALREMRAIFTDVRWLAGLAGVTLLLAISGPFGTLDALSFAPRLAYWAFTVPLTFGLGNFAAVATITALRGREPRWIVPAAAAVLTSLVVLIVVLLINWVALGLHPMGESYIGGLFFSIMATAAIVALGLYFASHHQSEETDAPPPLLERLDFAKRGALVSLSVQDHYVEIVTTKGTSLVLMRLSDAMRETAPTRGMQVHRSHWIALPQVASVKREGDKARITLKDGRDIPASRSYIPALKEAGLLPR